MLCANAAVVCYSGHAARADDLTSAQGMHVTLWWLWARALVHEPSRLASSACAAAGPGAPEPRSSQPGERCTDPRASCNARPLVDANDADGAVAGDGPHARAAAASATVKERQGRFSQQLLFPLSDCCCCPEESRRDSQGHHELRKSSSASSGCANGIQHLSCLA